jgi:N-acetylglucosamine-6-phosphate deacetylase
MLGPHGWGAYEADWERGLFRPVSGTADPILVPGFVDVHIHGAYGIDFMSANSEVLEVLDEKLAADGYEAYLPTTVTAPLEEIVRATSRLAESPMVKGFHLEGPFISPKFPGAQPQEFIQPVPQRSCEWDQVLDHPMLRLITLAPELPGALELILRLQQRGVTVSMGHTDATYEQARRGFEFGVRHATHTFNAMRPLHHREAGSVGYVLQQDGLNGELIYDRVHVAPDAARLLLRCKGPDGIIAVSDGTRAAGQPPGTRFTMWGLECVVGKGDVRLADGTLAGSAITLLHAFRNLFRDFGPEVAVKASSLNPRRVLGMSEPPSVWVEFSPQLELVRVRRAMGSFA